MKLLLLFICLNFRVKTRVRFAAFALQIQCQSVLVMEMADS